MNRIPVFQTIIMFSLTASVCGHLDRTSLSIKGGETFTAGDTVTITWKMTHAHPINHYIYFRPDSAATWNCIDSVKGKQSGLDYTYSWVVPGEASDGAYIKIFLPEFSKTPSEKTDDFTLISGAFTITSPKTIIVPAPPRSSMPGVVTRHQNVSFDLKGHRITAGYPGYATMCLIVNRQTIISNLQR